MINNILLYVAAEYFSAAADNAMAAGKGKLAQTYYEKAAMCE
jgi:hypothetical protein